MVASTDIKFYVHTNNNAPQLQNAYGSMINVLNACLVDGIQIGTISSLTASGKTITATFSSAHNLMQYQVIKIAGAAQAEFNGEHRVLTAPNAQTITFELAAVPSVTAATGAITASLPPLGWEKPFSSTNANGGGKAAYRSKNLLLASRPFLRVVDELDPAYTATYAKFAKVGIVEDMTDINTMLGAQAPYDSTNPDRNWVGTGSGTTAINGWSRWYYATAGIATGLTADSSAPSTGVRGYVLVGTGDLFYIIPRTLDTATAGLLYGFGSFKTFIESDTSNTFLNSTLNANVANNPALKASYTGIGGVDQNQLTLLQRKYTQDAVFETAAVVPLRVAASANYSGAIDYIGGKTLANSIPFSPVFINEKVLRGEFPLLHWLYQARPYADRLIYNHNLTAFINVEIAVAPGTTGAVVIKIGDL